ncbi:hypothetical protein COCNU_scaffold004624G000010 [Cocos nucifera]|nr:hypothetical protein [Cocos nucifera]
MKEKVVKVEDLWKNLRKGELTSVDLQATLALEEERRKKAEARVGKLKDQASKQILKAKIQAVEQFKISSEIRDLNVAFGQEAFQKGYELCEDRVAPKFLKLDLGFLYEEVLDEEAGLSTAAADPSPIKVISKPFEPIIDVPEPTPEPEMVKSTPTSFAAVPPEV